MAPLEARTLAEAYVYLETQLSGSAPLDFDEYTQIVEGPGNDWTLVFDGAYEGRHYHYEIWYPDRPFDDDGRVVYGYGPEPSTIVDAGYWLAFSVTGAALVTVALEELADLAPDPATYEQLVLGLMRADAMLAEVLKFIPPGAGEVPDTGFWTDLGQQARDRFPEQFQRPHIEADQDKHRRQLAAVRARYGAIVGD
jgi:hypothetical protein